MKIIEKILKNDINLLFALAMVLFLVKFPYFFFSGLRSPDELFYIQGASEIIKGNVLYQHFGEIKPPGVFFLYAVPLKIAGIPWSFFSLKLINGIFQLFSAFLVYKISHEWLKNKLTSFLFGAFFIILISVNYDLWPAHTMLLGIFPLLLFVYFFIKDNFRLSLKNLFWSGFFLSLSFLFNTNMIFYAGLYLFFLLKKERRPSFVMNSFTAFLGFLLPLIPFFLYFFYHHALEDYYWWNVRWASIYSHWYPFIRKIWAFLDSFREVWQWIPVYLAAAVSLAKISRKNLLAKNDPALFVFLFFLVSLGSRLLFRGAARYSLFLLPAFIFPIIVSFDQLKNLAIFKKKVFLGMGLACFGFSLVYANYLGITHSFDLTLEKRKPLIDLIKSETHAEDSIFVWHEANEIYLLSDRKMASSFYSTSNHLAFAAIWKRNQCREIEIPWNKFFMELHSSSPKLIIDLKPDFQGWDDPALCHDLKEYHEQFVKYVRDHYTEIRRIQIPSIWGGELQSVRIWKRK